MGLSRNKVAVSEGAAGSPPFYGEHEELSRAPRIQDSFRDRERDGRYKAACRTCCCSIFSDRAIGRFPKWGCSSAGRAPALQAGGHGFDSHHLHQARSPGGQISRGDFRNRFGITRWDEAQNEKRITVDSGKTMFIENRIKVKE